jgi:hypothetical protein
VFVFVQVETLIVGSVVRQARPKVRVLQQRGAQPIHQQLREFLIG